MSICVFYCIYFLSLTPLKSYLHTYQLLLEKKTPGFLLAHLDLATGCLQRLVAETGWAFFLVRLLIRAVESEVQASEIICDYLEIIRDFELLETHF